MTRVSHKSAAKKPRHEISVRTRTMSASRVTSSESKSDSSYSTMDSHPNQSTLLSEKRKSVYSEIDDSEYFSGKSSTEAVVGNSTYLHEKTEQQKEDDSLFTYSRSFRTPDWRKRTDKNAEDYVDNIRHALCSTAKKKSETAPRLTVVTPHMTTLQKRLVRKASIAAEKEMLAIERRVSLKKANESMNSPAPTEMDSRSLSTPARPPAFIDLSKIKPVPMSINKDGNPSPATPNFGTPASGSGTPFEIRKVLNTSAEANPCPTQLPTTTPVSLFAGTKRLTVQRASLDMSSILKGVVAYVEVRTNHDNLSQGVKAHVRTLGASVEENFTKKVTHVIFKEGMMSTYKKAERWRVPLVSALWIEACKNARKIVPAEEFPPIDIDRYRNALPFTRFRKKRSIQPISDIRKLPVRTNRKVNKLAAMAEEPSSSAPPKETRSIIEEINKELNNDKQIEDKYLHTLLSLAGPFLEEALNRSDSPTNEGDVYLPLSVRLLKKYMTPRGSRTESKTRVSELEKHLNLNQKGRSRLRKFLVFTSEDEGENESADKATQTDEESADDTISPVELPKILRKSAPARLLTAHKKRRKNKKDDVQQKKTLVSKPTVIVNKRKSRVAVENKENVDAKSQRKVEVRPTETKAQPKPGGKTNSAVKRKLLPTSQVIMLDAPVEDLSISKPVRPTAAMPAPSTKNSPKKRKGLEPVTSKAAAPASSSSGSSSRYSEMYGLMSSDEDERNSTAWFATPRRNKPLPKPVLVCTSLHTNESDAVVSIVNKLGIFEVEAKVNAQTTHIVAGGPRRTLNLIKGLARGCWIVKLEWAVQSMEAGKWLCEEPYELTEFSPAVKEVRLLRQSYKFLFSLDIFAPCGSIYVCQKTVPPRDDLKEILRLCSAVIVSTAKSAKIVIGNNVAGSLNVQEKWVLDCVSQNKLIDTKSYVIKRGEIKG